MAYLATADLYTVIYQENLEAIIRDDATIPTKAITAAVGEAKTHLGQYDLLALFGDDDTEPTFPDEFLKGLVKDMAAWYVIKLGNPNISTEMIRQNYEDAIEKLKAIGAGKTNPQGWPRYVATTTSPAAASGVAWNSNEKRSHHF